MSDELKMLLCCSVLEEDLHATEACYTSDYSAFSDFKIGIFPPAVRGKMLFVNYNWVETYDNWFLPVDAGTATS